MQLTSQCFHTSHVHAAAEPPASLPRDGGFGSSRHLTPQDSCHPVSHRGVHWTLGEGRSNICGEKLTVNCGSALRSLPGNLRGSCRTNQRQRYYVEKQ